MRNWLSIILAIALPTIALGTPRVRGQYANRISKIDIEQIQAAIAKERGVPRNIRTIEAVAPDKVTIETGGKIGLNLETYYNFTVSKRSGKWTVDSSSIEITDQPGNNHRFDSDATGR
jgi:hypothetical protein